MSNLLEQARFIRAKIEAFAQYAPDADAVEGKALYPSFEKLAAAGYTAAAGYKFTYGGLLWKTLQPSYTFVAHYLPGEGTESLFAQLDELHAGTADDPIPYSGNMALESGLYYVQGGAVYLCGRDTVNPVYADLADLVGLYVEVAA